MKPNNKTQKSIEALDLAFSLSQAGKTDEANAAYRTAIEEGKASGTARGRQDAARAAVNLGFNLGQAGKTDEANAAYRTAIEEGKASGTARGRQGAANAAFNLGLNLGQAEEARKAKEKEAEEQVEANVYRLKRVRDLGCVVPAELEGLVEQCRIALNRSDFAVAFQKNTAYCKERLMALEATAEPRIVVSIAKRDFHVDTWDDLEASLTNEGTAHAQQVSLKFTARVEAEYGEAIPRLDRGETATQRISIKLLGRGKVPVPVVVSFQDLAGRQYQTRQNIDIYVGTTESTEGSIFISGDYVALGGTKASDSVVRQTFSEAGAPGSVAPPAQVPTRPMKVCPYCGEKLNLPKTPKFCPNCAATLLQ